MADMQKRAEKFHRLQKTVPSQQRILNGLEDEHLRVDLLLNDVKDEFNYKDRVKQLLKDVSENGSLEFSCMRGKNQEKIDDHEKIGAFMTFLL